MNKSTSLYLDIIRTLAALLVFLSHARFPFFSQGQTWLPFFGHEMVVVFFVLSGFVIAHTVEKRGESWRGFAADRLSRLYSVILPALLLTAVVDAITRHLNPGLYASEVRPDHYFFRMLLAAGYLNESWQFHIKAGSNSPMWSLAYEFWYYFLFGGLVFARRWWKLLPVLAFFAATGYKIALLLPVWLLGVAAFHICRRRIVPPGLGAIAALISMLWLMITIVRAHPMGTFDSSWKLEAPLFFSGNFRADFVLAFFVTAHFIGVDAMLRERRLPESNAGWVRAIRFGAGCSFSLYLFHFPLLLVCKTLIPFDSHNTFQIAGVLLLILLITLALSQITEQRRELWRWLFRLLFGLSPDGRARVPESTATVNAL